MIKLYAVLLGSPKIKMVGLPRHAWFLTVDENASDGLRVNRLCRRSSHQGHATAVRYYMGQVRNGLFPNRLVVKSNRLP